MSAPPVSVVLPTRNRADHALACVRTILKNEGLNELLVIDQSDDAQTHEALSEIRDDRVRHVPTDTRGVGIARNLGIRVSEGEIIAFTDDDCRVASSWVASLRAVFAAQPDVSVVCGRVVVPEELRAQGFAESFEPRVREWQGRYPPFGQDWGITANMALRRDVVAAVGGFDPMLGAGSPLRAGEEPDLLFRVLRAGMKVVNAHEVTVDHLGVRAFGPESQRLMRGYARGTGAALFKHVRLGDPDAAGVYARFVGANVQRVAANVFKGQRPTGLGYLVSFLGGAVDSYRFRVDAHKRQFVPWRPSKRPHPSEWPPRAAE